MNTAVNRAMRREYKMPATTTIPDRSAMILKTVWTQPKVESEAFIGSRAPECAGDTSNGRQNDRRKCQHHTAHPEGKCFLMLGNTEGM